MADQVTVGALLRRTFGGLAPNAAAIAIYVAGLSAIGVGIELANDPEDFEASLRTSLLQFMLTLGSLFAQYVLLEHMLRKAGLIRVIGSQRFWAYIGQSILAGLGFIVGLAFLIVPGLILLARWSAAPGLLIGEQKGAIEALRESWELTRGHTGSLIVAILILIFVFIAGFATIVPFMLDGGTPGIVGTELAGNLASVVTCSFAVAVFSLLHAPTGYLSEVFE